MRREGVIRANVCLDKDREFLCEERVDIYRLPPPLLAGQRPTTPAYSLNSLFYPSYRFLSCIQFTSPLNPFTISSQHSTAYNLPLLWLPLVSLRYCVLTLKQTNSCPLRHPTTKKDVVVKSEDPTRPWLTEYKRIQNGKPIDEGKRRRKRRIKKNKYKL